MRVDRRTSLCKYAQNNGIDVDYFPMHSVGASSIPVNGSCAIAIDPSKVESLADETVKIAHELGHCKYGGFYCRHSPLDIKEQHEYKANVWAVRRLIPWSKLKQTVLSGMQTWELAEYFEVTETFLEWAIKYYTERKGYSFE